MSAYGQFSPLSGCGFLICTVVDEIDEFKSIQWCRGSLIKWRLECIEIRKHLKDL